MFRQALCFVAVIGLALSPSLADFNSGSDGSDGPLVVVGGEYRTIDLGQAATAVWNTPSPDPGKGVYDPDQWAVVFKYTTIDIAPSGIVEFINHPKGAPVVWLTTGDVTIDGDVNLDGETGHSAYEPHYHTIPGPGAFAGGLTRSGSQQPSGGFGPGGGPIDGGASYGTSGSNGPSTYGKDYIIPLIGGSGGGGGNIGVPSYDGGGGAGGGAILIASSATITLNGAIHANGGSGWGAGSSAYRAGGGSGGAIRLIAASEIIGPGQLRAQGGAASNRVGGSGRIRVEAPEISLTDSGAPSFSSSFATGPVFPTVFPPTLRATSVGGQPLPVDPDHGISTVDAQITIGDPVTLNIEATYIPPGVYVTVYVVGLRGAPTTYTSDQPLVGTWVSSSTTATITLPAGRSEIQLRVNWTP